MDRPQAMEVFVRVVDTASFTRTAEQMALPKATVSTLVQQLEARLGVRQLNRTTRRVNVTVDGAACYERCVRILADVEDSEHAIAGIGATFGRRVLVPSLPEFFRLYPEIRLDPGCGDRPVDVLEEGIDCVVRGGSPVDSRLIAQPAGELDLLYCAAPQYLAARGTRRICWITASCVTSRPASARLTPGTSIAAASASNCGSTAASRSTTAKPISKPEWRAWG